MGLSITNPSTVTPKLLVTKSNSAGPSLTSVVVTTVSGGTSSWTQIVASTGADTLITGIGFYCASALSSSTVAAAAIDLGRGGAGSESLLQSTLIAGSTSAAWFPGGWNSLSTPQRVASGQRLAVRFTQLQSWGFAPAIVVYIATVPYANIEGN